MAHMNNGLSTILTLESSDKPLVQLNIHNTIRGPILPNLKPVIPQVTKMLISLVLNVAHLEMHHNFGIEAFTSNWDHIVSPGKVWIHGITWESRIASKACDPE